MNIIPPYLRDAWKPAGSSFSLYYEGIFSYHQLQIARSFPFQAPTTSPSKSAMASPPRVPYHFEAAPKLEKLPASLPGFLQTANKKM